MQEKIPELAKELSGDGALSFASGIMTTDSYPKLRSVSVGNGRVVGIAKGAGMIEPDMATMLAFIVTDLDVDRDTCRSVLSSAVSESFNCISLDSDQSTSDMALLFASKRRGAVDRSEFARAVEHICRQLAEDIVRNGEGVGHVIRVTVEGAGSDIDARLLGKAVVNSPLVKTAIYGNDPNVGRILGALGDCAGKHNLEFDPATVEILLGDTQVFSGGEFHLDRQKEIQLSSYLKRASMNPRVRGYPQHERNVELYVQCGQGAGSARVLGSDLSDEYVHENADYRS